MHTQLNATQHNTSQRNENATQRDETHEEVGWVERVDGHVLAGRRDVGGREVELDAEPPGASAREAALCAQSTQCTSTTTAY